MTEEILQSVRKMGKCVHIVHLANRAALRNYERISGEIKSNAPEGKILDWGCGYGLMTFLLRKLGMDVVSFDVQRPSDFRQIEPLSDIQVVVGTDGSRLPFEDQSFGSVLSCGVLEHVPDTQASLAEINRVLSPGGRLFIYMLPQRYSWTEWISRRRGISVHPVLYTSGTISNLLEEGGFRVLRLRRSNFLPKNLTGLPGVFRQVYDLCPGLVGLIDSMISRVPLLNQMCGVLEVRAEKQ